MALEDLERTGANEYYLPEAECPPELSRGG
jgi:hypothetical protein